MEIITAPHAGFCFGVNRAVKEVYSIIESDKKDSLYTLGDLIHNPSITSDLKSKGVTTISSEQIDGIFENCTQEKPCKIIIRAHGVTKDIYEKLEEYKKKNPFFSYLDCTCPYVKKIHDIVKNNALEDTLLYIFGNPSHPEVKGIMSFACGEVRVISHSDDISYDEFAQKKVVLVSQTTQNLTEWKKTQKNIEKVYTNPLIFDTICNVTEIRQTETEKLAQDVDFMVIIGGRNSSNTNKLYEVSKKHLDSTVLIETADELPKDKLFPGIKVGISAGASTPGSIIEEVKKTMSETIEKLIDTDAAQESVNENDENSFAALLEKSFKTLNTGDIVKGTVTSVNSNEVHVDLGAKVTGIISSSEISDNPALKLEEAFKPGDEIEAMVTRVSDIDGVATLSKKRVDTINNWKAVVEAYKEGTILEGKITEVNKGGVVIYALSQKIFVPSSQTGLAKDADLNVLKGETKRFKIIDLNEQRKRAVASIKVVAREERKALEEKFWNEIEVDKRYEGTVKSMTTYGVFVDLGGVDGMVHMSELSWVHIKHPSDVVSVGQKINVFVKEFDKEKKRISLGYKTDDTDPWKEFTENFEVGDVARVKIVSMMPFGAFAEILPGVDGLIHISQIADKKINKPADVLTNGQEVEAKVTEIDNEKRKVSLSIRALIEEEKAAAEEMPADYVAEETATEEKTEG